MARADTTMKLPEVLTSSRISVNDEQRPVCATNGHSNLLAYYGYEHCLPVIAKRVEITETEVPIREFALMPLTSIIQTDLPMTVC